MSSPTGEGEPPVISGGQPISIRIRGWLFGAGMLFSAYFGVIYIASPLLVLLFFKPRLYRKLLDRLVGVWVIMPGALMEYIFGAKVRIKGDFINHEDAALIIMNHRTRLDWLFFWNALYKMDPWLCTTEKITLKGMLKFVPGAGWAMQAASYIFLDRSFETDKTKLDSILNYFSATGNKYQVLLFPEGTDKCPLATERSRVYAEKNGLVNYKYLLHPRVTGFVHIIQTMRQANNIKWIYDVTIGFGDAIVQSEVDMVLHGVVPTEVSYQVIKIPIHSLPESDEGLQQWLINLWKDKEEKLRRFYSLPRNIREFENTPDGMEYDIDENTDKAQKGIVALWIFTTLFWIFMFFESAIMFYWALIMTVFYIAIHKFYGGLEFLAIDQFNSTNGYGIIRQREMENLEQTTINT